MSAGRSVGATATVPRARGLAAFDPFRFCWDLLTNVKFALLLVGSAVVAGVLGTTLPQLPAPMRSNPAARAAWLELRRDDFGPFTGALDRAGLFDVFRAPWFTALWVVIIVAVTVCTVSRLRPTFRNVSRPPRAVPDAYFDRAHHRAEFLCPGGEAAVAGYLRRRRYQVQRVSAEGEAATLFADRYAWSQYATFVSHLTLLLLLVGGLLTSLAGFSRALVIVERNPAAPVFDEPGPGQLFIDVIDTYRGFNAAGNIVAYHTDVTVRRGTETVSCRVTVNGPCRAFGYRVHQAAFVDDLARLRIVDPQGVLRYDGVLDFEGRTTAVPAIRVTAPGGGVLVEEPMPQLATDTGASATRDDDLALGAFELSASDGLPGLSIGLAWQMTGRGMRLAVSSPSGLRSLVAGDGFSEGPYRIEFLGPRAIPAVRVDDMPGAGEAGATVQMVPRADGSNYLVVSGVDPENVVVASGGAVQAESGYRYGFAGRAEAAGLDVRRDPGDTFIWIAVGLGLMGLAVTFYVPRRRLWLKIEGGRARVAGIADRTTRLDRELRRMGRELAGPWP